MADGSRYTGRAQLALNWLATQSAPKTARHVIEAVDPTCPQANMAGTLATLAHRGKLARHKTADGIGFTVTATAFVDERVAANRVPGGKNRSKAKAPAKKARGDRTSAIKAAAGKHAQPKPTVAKDVPPVRRMSNDNFFLRTEVDARQPMREALAADVAAFEAAGGVIQRLAPGESSRPLTTAHEWNEASWRARERRLAAQAQNQDTDDGDLADVA